MTTKETEEAKIAICEALIEKSKGYGGEEKPITISVFKSILNDIKTESLENLRFAYLNTHSKSEI